jgi:predicted membrane-bound mannosyltransferase
MVPSATAVVICRNRLTRMSPYVGYLAYTGLTERSVDVLVELDYIRFIAHEGRLPSPDHCSVCHHPPLYFLSAAVWLKLVEATRLLRLETGLQVWSLVCFVGFVTCAMLTFRRFSTRPAVVRLATALVVFWPGSILTSVRVHNDVLASALMAGTLLFTVRWHQEDRPADLYRAAALAALGVLTKANAYAIVLVLLVVCGQSLYRKRPFLPQLERMAPAFVVIFAAAALGLSRKGPGPTLCHRVLGVACNISSEHFVPNRPPNYLYFDLRAFLAEPFFSSLAPNVDRDYFWNSLVKTSLFGTEVAGDPELGYRLNAELATVMSWLVLGMIVYALVGALGVSRAGLRRHGVLLVASAALVGSLIALRVLIPTPYHEDFRHVFPLVIPAGLLFAELVDRYRTRSPALAWVGYLLSVPLLLLSVLFFAPKQLLATSLSRHIIEPPFRPMRPSVHRVRLAMRPATSLSVRKT